MEKQNEKKGSGEDIFFLRVEFLNILLTENNFRDLEIKAVSFEWEKERRGLGVHIFWIPNGPFHVKSNQARVFVKSIKIQLKLLTQLIRSRCFTLTLTSRTKTLTCICTCLGMIKNGFSFFFHHKSGSWFFCFNF